MLSNNLKSYLLFKPLYLQIGITVLNPDDDHISLSLTISRRRLRLGTMYDY